MELELFRKISEFGLLGIILALVWWIAHGLWRDLQSSWHERLAENKHILSVIQTTNSSYEALAVATENRAKAHDLMAQAHAATSQTLSVQAKELERLVAKNEEIARNVDRLSLQVERLRPGLGSGTHPIDQARKSPRSSR